MKWNEFEKQVLNLFKLKGFWAHLFAKDNFGNQPFDVLAFKDDLLYAIDCKVINTKSARFPISRIEQNQRLSFMKIKKVKKDAIVGLLVEHNSKVYFIDFETIDFTKSSIELKEELLCEFL